MFRLFVVIISSIAVFSLSTQAIQADSSGKVVLKETDTYVEYKIKGVYEDIREDIEFAITGTGIKINTIAHTGDMLIRTGKDLGATKLIFKHAEAFEFCSATVSRASMEADPRNFMFCPYIIYVYQLGTDKGIVYVSYRRPSYGASKKSDKALKGIEKLLKEIISEAIE